MSMPAIDVRPADYETDVKPFQSRAAKEHVDLSDTLATRWWGIWVDGVCVGVTGMAVEKGIARLRGGYVQPASRGKGYSTVLLETLIGIAEELGLQLEAIAYNPHFFLQRGWRMHGPYRPGWKPERWVVRK